MPAITRSRASSPAPKTQTPRAPSGSRAAKASGDAKADAWRPRGAGNATPPAQRAPKSVRDAGELNVAWASVRLVEDKIATRNPGYDALKESGDFQRNLAGDLKNFLQYGKSSLTPYEARQVGNGLGFRDVGGFGYGNTPTTWGAYTRGDRVEATIDGQKRRGILADVRPPELRVLWVKDGQFALDPVSEAKILAAGLNDGRS